MHVPCRALCGKSFHYCWDSLSFGTAAVPLYSPAFFNLPCSPCIPAGGGNRIARVHRYPALYWLLVRWSLRTSCSDLRKLGAPGEMCGCCGDVDRGAYDLGKAVNRVLPSGLQELRCNSGGLSGQSLGAFARHGRIRLGVPPRGRTTIIWNGYIHTSCGSSKLLCLSCEIY